MKKIKSSISRNLILSFVLLVTILFAVFAWFYFNSRSEVKGVSVASISAKGLEVAFEDKDEMYSDLIVDDSKKYYPLISGDGTTFMIPNLNRSTGEPLTPYSIKRDPVANKDYYEADLYFRSDQELNIRLVPGSKIVPNDFRNENDTTIDNKSTFGDFSKDYIAGAARVAFYNVDFNGNETFNSIWIPNSSYQLIESSNFTKVKPTSEGSSDGWNIPGTLDYANPLYLHERYTKGTTSSIERQNTKMHYDSVTNKYYGVLDIFGTLDVDHMVTVSTSNAEYPSSSTILTNKSYSDFYQYKFYEPNYYVTVGLGGTFNADNTTWPKLYFGISENNKNLFNNVCGFDRFQVLMSYDKVNDKIEIIDFIYYEKDNPSNRGGGTGDFGTGSSYYELNDNTVVTIGGIYTDLIYGLTFTNNSLKSSIIYDNLDTIVNNNSNTMFLVDKLENNTYTLKHLPTNKYLSYNDSNEIVLSNSATAFNLSVGKNGPLLGIDSVYIDFQGGYFYTTTEETASIVLYEGNTYSFIKNGTPEESYQYITVGNNSPIVLPNTSYFTDISRAPLMGSLSKIDNSGYYKAHIRVRIWAEGTDREAKIPLAGGIFDNILMFEGYRKDE